MGRRGVEITLLLPELRPTCFDCLGVVDFVELGSIHLLEWLRANHVGVESFDGLYVCLREFS